MGKDDKVQLGRILLKRKMVTPDELDKALREQKGESAAPKPLASRLTDDGTMRETDALKALSEQHGVPAIDLRQVIITKGTLALVPREVAEGRRLVPFLVEDDKLFVAMANPGDKRMLDELEFVTALRVFPYVAMEGALDRTIASAYDAIAAGQVTYEGALAPKRQGGATQADPDDMSVGGTPSVVVDDDTMHAAETARMNTDGFGDTRDEVSSVMNVAPVARVAGQDCILVVDDDEDIRKLVRRLLTEKGYRVIEAKKGDEALRLVKDAAVDLIILDAMLPEVHGFDIAKQLKGSEKYGHIPIIMISAEHRGWRIAEDVKTNYGIDEYVEKPFAAAGFLQTVTRVLAKSKEKHKSPRDPEDIRADAKTALDEGVRLYKDGRVQEAIDELKRGIKLDPLAYRLRYHLGLLYGKQGRVHDGVHELERAVELHPKAFMAVKNLAVLYEKAGFKNKAVEMWEKCVELSPDDETRRQIREHLAALV